MSKVTFALIAAGGAAAGAAATAALYSTKKEQLPTPVTTTTTTTTIAGPPRPAPVPSVPSIPAPAAAYRTPLVDPNGLFQYGFPGPVNDLRPAASLTSSYDRERRNPAWVAEHITPQSLASSNADRKHSVFVEDITIPEKFRAKLKDYFRSGYDRGHQVPAADAKWSQEAMDDTFALSNMCPQVGDGFNRDFSNGGNIQPLHVEPHFTGNDTAHFEKVLDQLVLGAGISLDGFQPSMNVLSAHCSVQDEL